MFNNDPDIVDEKSDYMVNINMELPEELHKKVKIAALMSDTSLKNYIITVLEKRSKNNKIKNNKIKNNKIKE